MIYDHSYAGMNVVEVGGGGVHEENVGKLGGADGYNIAASTTTLSCPRSPRRQRQRMSVNLEYSGNIEFPIYFLGSF